MDTEAPRSRGFTHGDDAVRCIRFLGPAFASLQRGWFSAKLESVKLICEKLHTTEVEGLEI